MTELGVPERTARHRRQLRDELAEPFNDAATIFTEAHAKLPQGYDDAGRLVDAGAAYELARTANADPRRPPHPARDYLWPAYRSRLLPGPPGKGHCPWGARRPMLSARDAAHQGPDPWRKGQDMKSKKLLAALVAAITMLVAGLGMALWPSSSGAVGSIRKFSGLLFPEGNAPMTVLIHNPHPTYTFKPTVIVRDFSGAEVSRSPDWLTVGPNAGTTWNHACNYACSVEVNMTSALLQPSIRYFSAIANQWQHVYAGDFSR